MTNEEKAQEIGEKCATIAMEMCSCEYECTQSALLMAEWKDEQYKEREEGLRKTIDALDAKLQKANESGMYYFDKCNIQKQALIDKACEWLRNNMYEGTCEQMLSKKPYPFMRDFIEEFKQAVKGGEK